MSANGYTTSAAVAVGTQVLALVASRGAHGLTVAELRDIATDHHHGTLSGTLSNLHRKGEIAMLTEKRKRCRVYVLPENVNGRATKAHGLNHLDNIAAA